MKDMVVGFITNYKFEKLKPWIYSLKDSGFSGDILMFCYNIEFIVAEKLQQLGIKVVAFDKDESLKSFVYRKQFNIVNERFYHAWLVLKQLQEKYRYVICTDVADIIFQNNPSTWLEKNMKDKKICVGSEGLKYKDEDWGIHNMYQSFGNDLATYMSEKTICNAGSIAGEYETFLDLALNIYLLCKGAPMDVPGGGGADQASLNVLLSLIPYKDLVKFNSHDDAWACQCGTTVDPSKIDRFAPKLVDNEPFWKDGVAYTSPGRE